MLAPVVPAPHPPVDPAPARKGRCRLSAVDDLPNPRWSRTQPPTRPARAGQSSDVVNGKACNAVEDEATAASGRQGRRDRSRLTVDRATGAVGRAARRRDQYVELGREKTDRIFVILAEFGNERHPSYPDQDTNPATPGPARFDGPLHNEIPEPDRARGQLDGLAAGLHADLLPDLYFGRRGVESLKTYYETQSSGRYSVDGEVTDWVKVRYNEARYGRSNDIRRRRHDPAVCRQRLQQHLGAGPRRRQPVGRRPAGRRPHRRADRRRHAAFDQWDRYDFDGDGNFNESDGYIDHFQIVHAGGDQADGDPRQGEDAIWSHRWYAFQHRPGSTGPAGNRLGGTQIGDTGIWIGDYTIQPENGGLERLRPRVRPRPRPAGRLRHPAAATTTTSTGP